MASEILCEYDSGLTLYFTIMNAAGQRWNGAAFENYNSANWGNYDVALTEQGATGSYLGDFPAGIAAGVYRLAFYYQDGGAPAVDDEKIDAIGFNWDGAAEITLRQVDSNVSATLADTNELQTDLADGGRLDLLLDGVKAKTDNLPADPATETNVTAVGNAVMTRSSQTSADAIKERTDRLPDSPAAVGSVMQIDLTQAIDESHTGGTIGAALNGARVQAFGRWLISDDGLTLTLYRSDGTTPVIAFALPSAKNPKGRTPQ